MYSNVTRLLWEVGGRYGMDLNDRQPVVVMRFGGESCTNFGVNKREELVLRCGIAFGSRSWLIIGTDSRHFNQIQINSM